MANNRIGIQCKVCGQFIPLAKSLGGGFYVSPAFSIKYLEQFFDAHAFCLRGDENKDVDEGDFCIAYQFPVRDQIQETNDQWMPKEG